jgi:hypothetical protein
MKVENQSPASSPFGKSDVFDLKGPGGSTAPSGDAEHNGEAASWIECARLSILKKCGFAD